MKKHIANAIVSLFLSACILSAATNDFIFYQVPASGSLTRKLVTPGTSKLVGWGSSASTPVAITIGSGLSLNTSTNTLTASGGGGSGTVTSVALSVPSILAVAGSPVTTSGTIALSLDSQSANRVFAGPTTGADATPTFRALVADDIPSLSSVYQPLASALTTLSSATAAGLALMDDADNTAQRATLGLGDLATLSAVGSAQITNDTIVNADISASAAIALSKLATDPLARANHTGTQAWSTIATTPTTLAGYGITDAQPLDAELTTLSSATAAGLALMDDADAAAQRTTLGLASAALLGANQIFTDTNIFTVGPTEELVVLADAQGLRIRDNAVDTNTINLIEVQDEDGNQTLVVDSGGALTAVGGITAASFSGTGSALTGLHASNIASGTVATARLGSGTANSSTFLRGDNTWATPAGSGTVTATSGTLTASAIMVGNGTTDIKALASLGTTTTVLHGNASGLPTWGEVILTTDTSGNYMVDLAGTANQITVSHTPGEGSTATVSLPANITGLTSVTSTGFTGALTGNASTATALATARTIGGTSFDGTGNIVPATITVADTTDATAYVAIFESATGDLEPKTDGGLTYNASNGTLNATTFAGAGGGLTLDASGFNGNLTTSDNTVQEVAQKLDDLSASGGGGNWVLVSTTTISGSPSTVDFTLTGGYRKYKLEFENVYLNADGYPISIRTSTDGGSTFDAGASDYDWGRGTLSGYSPTNTTGSGVELSANVGSGTDEGMTGEVIFHDPLNTGLKATMSWMVHHLNYGATAYNLYGGAGRRNSTGDVDAVRVITTSTFAGGKIRLFRWAE